MVLQIFWYQLFCVFILGLILGSFYNVVIIRSLKGESIVIPGSHCPECKTPLLWWQNIPLLSYIILKGKCHFCHKIIDIQYPIVELLSGLLFVVSFIKYEISLKTILCFICLSIFLILACMDIKGKVISEKMAISLMFFSILFNCNFSAIIAGILLFILFFIVKKILDKFFSQEVIGEGDIYALSALGTFVGLSYVFYALILTLLFQFLFCLPEYIRNLINNKKYNIMYLGTWFLFAYCVLFFIRFYAIMFNPFMNFLTIVNVIIPFVWLCKLLIFDIKNSSISLIEPLCPAIFLSAFIYLFLI